MTCRHANALATSGRVRGSLTTNTRPVEGLDAKATFRPAPARGGVLFS